MVRLVKRVTLGNFPVYRTFALVLPHILWVDQWPWKDGLVGGVAADLRSFLTRQTYVDHLDTLDVKLINEITKYFRKGDFRMLVLTGNKIKGNGDWYLWRSTREWKDKGGVAVLAEMYVKVLFIIWIQWGETNIRTHKKVYFYVCKSLC